MPFHLVQHRITQVFSVFCATFSLGKAFEGQEAFSSTGKL